MNKSRLSLLTRKNLWLFLALSLFSISLMALIWHHYSLDAQQQLMEEALTEQTRMLGMAVRPALSFHDRQYAANILDGMEQEGRFNSVHVFDANHALLASTGMQAPGTLRSFLQGVKPVVMHRDGALIDIQPVLLKGELLGYVTTTTDEQALLKSLRDPYHIILSGMAAAFLATMLLALLFHRRYERAVRHNDMLMDELADKNRALEQARDEAERANAAKDSFLTNISHELRTPLNGILGMNQLLRQSGLAESQREFSDSINHSARHLLSLVEQLLDLSIIEAQEAHGSVRDFSPSQLLSDLVRSQLIEARNKGLDLSMHIDRKVPAVMSGQPMRLQQVLTNVINNAIRYTRKGFVHIGIYREDTGLHLQIRDSGPGIAPDEQRRIFEKFYRGRRNDHEQIGGTGLGLAISHKLLEQLGGSIKLESSSELGSTFHIHFPCQPQEASLPTWPRWLQEIRIITEDEWLANQVEMYCSTPDNPQPPRISNGTTQEPGGNELRIIDTRVHTVPATPPAAAQTLWLLPPGEEEKCQEPCLIFPCSLQRFREILAQITPVSGGVRAETSEQQVAGSVRGRVLIVEDNAINRKIARAALLDLGVDITEAINGREAISLVRSRPFDCVLMDIRMPDMDGIVATRLIREVFNAEQLPIIGVTAHALQAEIEKALAAGMDRVITKPIDIQALARDVRDILARNEEKVLKTEIDLRTLQQDMEDDPAMLDALLAEMHDRLREAAENFGTLIRTGDTASLPLLCERLSDTLATLQARQALRQLHRFQEALHRHDEPALHQAWPLLQQLLLQTAQELKAERKR